VFSCVCALAPHFAFAQAPAFTSMDRQDEQSRIGIEASYLFDRFSAADVIVRSDLHGQYFDASSRVGAYVALPAAFEHVNLPTAPSTIAIGDAELGGIYAPRLRAPDASLILHAGITLPIASASLNRESANGLAAFTRIDDVYLAIPHGLSGRVGVSPIVRRGVMFARLDLGVDANSDNRYGTSISPGYRINAGVGVDAGQLAVMAESVNVYDTVRIFGEPARWLDLGALSVRFRGKLQPYAAIQLPIDNDAAGAMRAAVTLGIDGVLP
jgi:hypothetical protein